MARFEKALLRYLFNRTHGNQSLMARQLGLHRTTLRNKLKLYELG
jgi:DNA-binding protein Fis